MNQGRKKRFLSGMYLSGLRVTLPAIPVLIYLCSEL